MNSLSNSSHFSPNIKPHFSLPTNAGRELGTDRREEGN